MGTAEMRTGILGFTDIIGGQIALQAAAGNRAVGNIGSSSQEFSNQAGTLRDIQGSGSYPATAAIAVRLPDPAGRAGGIDAEFINFTQTQVFPGPRSPGRAPAAVGHALLPSERRI